eukprot:s5284_g1.t1
MRIMMVRRSLELRLLFKHVPGIVRDPSDVAQLRLGSMGAGAECVWPASVAHVPRSHSRGLRNLIVNTVRVVLLLPFWLLLPHWLLLLLLLRLLRLLLLLLLLLPLLLLLLLLPL